MHVSVCVCVRTGCCLCVRLIPLSKPLSQSQLCINYNRRDTTSSFNSSSRFLFSAGRAGQRSRQANPCKQGGEGEGEQRGRKKVAKHPDQRVGDKGGPVCAAQNQTEPHCCFCGPPKNFSITKRIPPSCFHLLPPPQASPLCPAS